MRVKTVGTQRLTQASISLLYYSALTIILFLLPPLPVDCEVVQPGPLHDVVVVVVLRRAAVVVAAAATSGDPDASAASAFLRDSSGAVGLLVGCLQGLQDGLQNITKDVKRGIHDVVDETWKQRGE